MLSTTSFTPHNMSASSELVVGSCPTPSSVDKFTGSPIYLSRPSCSYSSSHFFTLSWVRNHRLRNSSDASASAPSLIRSSVSDFCDDSAVFENDFSFGIPSPSLRSSVDRARVRLHWEGSWRMDVVRPVSVRRASMSTSVTLETLMIAHWCPLPGSPLSLFAPLFAFGILSFLIWVRDLDVARRR